jgi:Transposase IS66 family
VFFYSRSRSGERPDRHLAGYARILQADAYAGFGKCWYEVVNFDAVVKYGTISPHDLDLFHRTDSDLRVRR